MCRVRNGGVNVEFGTEEAEQDKRQFVEAFAGENIKPCP